RCEVRPVQDIVRLERRTPSGWTIGMILVPIADGGLLVYSPTWLGEDTVARVRAHGEPRVIVAPNAFHHLSLGRYREAFPEAMAVAADAARGRLERKGHRGVAPLEEAATALGDGVALVAVPHTKTGESWVVIDGDRGPTWVTGDAFF